LETAKEMPLAEAVKIRNIKNVIVGGGAVISELVSARLFPCFGGKYREIRPTSA
jgi:hypothetical protein